ncbi:MAG: hypothetical protein EHM87_22455 [Burkholderiales bacterium]|nr:MAG: hypothetical protein EHM87_22455 [Burkholderiales bacterium]
MRTSTPNGNTQKSYKRMLKDSVSLTEAATILGVGKRTILDFMESGLLCAKSGRRNIDLNDIAGLAEVLRDKNRLNPLNAVGNALQALIRTMRLEKRVSRMEGLLGVDAYEMPMSEDDITTTYAKCRTLASRDTSTLRASEVIEWAYTFGNVTEEYLDLVAVYTSDHEPWVAYLEAAQSLAVHAPRDQFPIRKDLEVAYAYLTASRKHLRQVAYFYVRKAHGKPIADRAFPETVVGDRDDAIMNVVFSLDAFREKRKKVTPGLPETTPDCRTKGL